MGHTTRCIPVIRQLLQQHCEVIFAGIEIQINLIKKDFPEIICEKIPGYEITLDSKASTYRQIIAQFRKMKKMAKQEHLMANDLVKRYNAEVVISDNRYGFYANEVCNIMITHQLNPVIPIFRKSVRNLISTYIASFDVCWIPDDREKPVCKELLDAKISIPVCFIGLLSRFRKIDLELELDVLVIVSGPEPERSRFQDEMHQFFKDQNWKYKIVTPTSVFNDSFICNPSSSEMEQWINKSSLVIAKGGYTTIMELIHLQKKAILIPTPGQFEQEYLANIIEIPYLRFMTESEMKQIMNKTTPIKNLV